MGMRLNTFIWFAVFVPFSCHVNFYAYLSKDNLRGNGLNGIQRVYNVTLGQSTDEFDFPFSFSL